MFTIFVMNFLDYITNMVLHSPKLDDKTYRYNEQYIFNSKADNKFVYLKYIYHIYYI